MKIAVLCAVLLAAATAGAATNSDHFYVGSTGVTVVAALRTSADISSTPIDAATPVTDFNTNPPALSPAEERALIEGKIKQLQMELNALLIPPAGETADEAVLRQQEIAGKQRKINRLRSELMNIPVQSIQLN